MAYGFRGLKLVLWDLYGLTVPIPHKVRNGVKFGRSHRQIGRGSPPIRQEGMYAGGANDDDQPGHQEEYLFSHRGRVLKEGMSV